MSKEDCEAAWRCLAEEYASLIPEEYMRNMARMQEKTYIISCEHV